MIFWVRVVLIGLSIGTTTSVAFGAEAQDIQNALVEVEAPYYGRFLNISKQLVGEGFYSKKANGFLVRKEGKNGPRYYVVTVKHVLQHFANDDGTLMTVCNVNGVPGYCDPYAGRDKATTVKILKADTGELIEVNLKESGRLRQYDQGQQKRGDIAVINLSGLLLPSKIGGCVSYDDLVEIQSAFSQNNGEVRLYGYQRVEDVTAHDIGLVGGNDFRIRAQLNSSIGHGDSGSIVAEFFENQGHVVGIVDKGDEQMGGYGLVSGADRIRETIDYFI